MVLFKTNSFCSMVSRDEDIDTIIKSMKGFITAFGLKALSGEQVVGLFKTDRFCSMVSRAEDIDTIIKSMKGFIAAFGLRGLRLCMSTW